MSAPLKLLVLCPHFEPDTAPTGVVMTRIVHELAELGHEIHVVTALPWYREHRVESEWVQVTWRTRTSVTAWGSVTRLNPLAGDDKKNLCAPGCLDQRACLRFALMWLKRIDEGNKVCVCVVCLASCLALHSPRT